jgi:hypothetical protein
MNRCHGVILSAMTLCLSIILCSSSVIAQEVSKFRGLQVGMTVQDLSTEVEQKGFESILWFSAAQDASESTVLDSPGLAIVRKGSFEAAGENKITWASLTGSSNSVGSANISLIDGAPITVGFFKKITGPGSFHYISNNGKVAVTGDPSFIGRTIYIRSNEFQNEIKVNEFTLEPSFFEASGISGEDFGRSLLEKYAFVDNGLYGGQEKGIQCYCYVGLLSTGEGVILSMNENNPLDWNLRVFWPAPKYTALFTQTSPSFD